MKAQSDLSFSELPPQLVLYQMAVGHYLSRALNLVTKLGIPDLLGRGPRHFRDLAEATGTHAPSLNRLLRLLASTGVLEEQADGQFALTPLGDCLRADAPGSARSMVMLFAGMRMHDAFGELEHCVRTGESVMQKRGITDPFSVASDAEEGAAFEGGMADVTRLMAMAVVGAYDFSPFGTIVDIGGGNGALLISILQAMSSQVRGVVFDMPEVAARARKQIVDSGLGDRCQAIGGDFFKEVPGGGDAYVVKHVIHDWDDERAVRILENVHRAMKPDAKLLILEGVYPQRIDQSLDSKAAAANDVNMLVNTGGRERSESEFRSLYQAAGFELTKIVPTLARVSVIEGVRV